LLVPSLRRVRLLESLSQEELAKRARLHRTTVMHLEAGGQARPRTVRKLAQALDVHPRELQAEPPA
jgi:transcriptional regulator with XRE-family HTH domain